MAKSPGAFRTISEVSAWLETPPHVLRFWETKFTQVKPVKRAGGRRYYRPEDIALLGGIKVLLHEQGMTIRGVQKMLREQGARHVSSLSAQVWSEEGVEAEEADALDAALDDGVIVGPWSGPGRETLEEGLERDAAEEDLADLAVLDGLAADDAALEAFAAREAAALEAAEAVEARLDPGAEAPTLIESFLAGTMSRLAQGANGREPPPEAADAHVHEAWADASPASAPTPTGERNLARALDLVRRADPERLRARADRIAPLLQRLRTLQAGLRHPSP